MADFTLVIETDRPYDETVEAVREQLGEAGFGVLTEIDLQATLRAKLGVEIAPQVILGACRPQLAHQALEAEPAIAALLPCNVVVRSTGETSTVVEAFDPAIMTSIAGDVAAQVEPLATDARARLQSALAVVESLGGGR